MAIMKNLQHSIKLKMNVFSIFRISFSDIKRAHRPEFDGFSQSLLICMRKIESAIKPELEKLVENKFIDIKMVRYGFYLFGFTYPANF